MSSLWSEQATTKVVEESHYTLCQQRVTCLDVTRETEVKVPQTSTTPNEYISCPEHHHRKINKEKNKGTTLLVSPA